MVASGPLRIGCCITPHGFGHAARSCAIMDALASRMPVHFEIVSTVPEWFFAESLTVSYILHFIPCDVGLVQRNSLEEDLGQTLECLDRFYPLDQSLVDRVAVFFEGCAIVICDIAPLGIAAAQQAGVVSVLVENFTWDWIYQSYLIQWPGFAPHIDYIRKLYGMADYHLQTDPVCDPVDCDLVLPPIARQRRQKSSVIREQLEVAPTDDVVLVTMGGVPGTEIALTRLADMDQCFILPGQAEENMVVQEKLRLLPPDSGLYHPDLVAACDVVIAKVGYSTLAEVYQAGVPFGYIRRKKFRESGPLASFIERKMVSLEIPWQQFHDNSWLDRVEDLCTYSRDTSEKENGSAAAAEFLINLVHSAP